MTTGKPPAKLIGLSKFEEEEIIKTAKRRALKKCDPFVLEYIECARTNMIPTKCKELVQKMNNCVRQYTREEDIDLVRREYHADKLKTLAEMKLSQ